MPNLVGIGNSQVSTNAMLGGLAYQNSVGEIVIDKIKAKTSDTATDIFVYDTRKDSDGGAWRHRTQNTSWYNEGVSATRGARKEFPAVAVIVAEQNFITIYDGDDPNLSTWMVFYTISPTGTSQGMGFPSQQGRPMVQLQGVDKVVHMLNGILVTGTKNEGSNYGQPIINFINEKVLRMDSQGGEGGEWIGNIAQRNEALGYRHVTYDYVIKASQVNDVSMTVLPNAPIDESTGLPIPTIAAGTEGGLSIITDNGKVYDHTGFSPVSSTNMGGDTVVVALGRASTVNFLYKTNLPSADESFDTHITAGSGNFYMNSNSGTTPLLRYLDDTVESFNQLDGTVYRGGSKGFDIITNTETVSSTVNNSLIAYIASNYNTGYMHGDIKGAFLADTDDTNITGTNLVTNGDFSDGTNGWTAANAAISESGGVLTVSDSSNAGADSQAFRTVTGLTVGKVYNVGVRHKSSSQHRLWIGTGSGPLNSSTQNVLSQTYSAGSASDFVNNYYTFTASTTSVTVALQVDGTGTAFYNWIYINESVEDDRSVNNNPLQVFGTITKSAVATGAELVAYSGFTNSNYLQQPYNSDLQFGTGDWAFYGWYNDAGGSGSRTIFELGRSTSAGDHIGVRHDGTNLELFISDDGFSSQDVAEFSADAVDEWQFCCALRRDNQIELWNNGVLKATKTIEDAAGDLGDDQTYLRFGNRTYTSQPWDGSLALWRVSKTAPTPEQIKKMYYDEKCLYHENAQATLYGTSDAVTGLAFDDSNNTLHVGTSAGRSEFQGLNRINNTTTAVTTAISASNGLVAEQ